MSGTIGVSNTNETFQIDRTEVKTANGGTAPSSIVLELVTIDDNTSLEAWEPVFQEYLSIVSA